jgi:nucleotide-binding universal stress UspA family protein
MFKRILVATDGSKLSETAISKAVEFAKAVNASVYGFHASYEFAAAVHGVDVSSHDFREVADREARKYLASIEAKAREADVHCDTGFEVNNSPYRAIIKAADDQRCDLIFMASHGRRGVSAWLLGSETQKVLTHSKIPVLVYRDSETHSDALESVNAFRA